MTQIEESTREQVARFLPVAIQKAADSYRLFMQGNNTAAVSKDFAEHHKACKVAIAHLDLLLKLAHWADLPCEQAEEELQKLETMICDSARKSEAASKAADEEKEDLA